VRSIVELAPIERADAAASSLRRLQLVADLRSASAPMASVGFAVAQRMRRTSGAIIGAFGTLTG
jgi:hypothetical protein